MREKELISEHMNKTKLDINNTLKIHFLYSNGTIANYLRLKCGRLSNKLNQYFEARSNIERITTAIEVVKVLSRLNDMDDQLPFNALIAKIEYLRLLKYEKQRDHIAHTLNNFLLGIYLVDCNDELFDLIKKDRISKIGIKEKDYTLKYFLLEWMYASTYHDVGYAFSELLNSNESKVQSLIAKITQFFFKNEEGDANLHLKKEIILMIDKLFSADYAYDYIKDEFEMKYNLKSETDNFYKMYKHNFNFDAKSEEEFFGNILYEELLSKMFVEDVRINDDSYMLNNVKIKRKEYSNHALMGGLIMFKYVEHWYELYNYLERKGLVRKSKYKYDFSSRAAMREGIVCMALHDNDSRINIHQNSILYLSILCDELQIWDRYASGVKAIDEEISHILDVQSCKRELNRKEDELKMTANEIDLVCCVDGKLNKKTYFVTSSSNIENMLINNLSEKLVDFNKYIRILRID